MCMLMFVYSCVCDHVVVLKHVNVCMWSGVYAQMCMFMCIWSCFLVYCLQKWNDELLTWDPTKYDNITSIVLLPDAVWLPEIQVLNRSAFQLLNQQNYASNVFIHITMKTYS